MISFTLLVIVQFLSVKQWYISLFPFQEKSSEFIYFGWKHREDPSSSFVQVKGVENGGGLRRIPYDDITKAQLLERAQQLFFPNGKNSSQLENCEVGLGNFAGEPFKEEESFESSLSDYSARHGLFASKVRFYLLTTKRNSCSQVGEDVDGKEDLWKEKSLSKSSMSSSNAFSLLGTSLDHSLATPLDQCEKNDQDAVFYVDDSRRNLSADFRRVLTSEYTQELSTLFVSGWSNCYTCRSVDFLDQSEEEYHPCDDSFVISNLTVGGHVYLEPLFASSGTPDSEFIQSYVPAITTQSHDQPEILNGPDEVYGYEGNQLFLAVVTNFHNEIGVTYEWSLDGNTVLYVVLFMLY